MTLQIILGRALQRRRRPVGLINGKAPGNRPKPNDDQRRALARIVKDSPIPAIRDGVQAAALGQFGDGSDIRRRATAPPGLGKRAEVAGPPTA